MAIDQAFQGISSADVVELPCKASNQRHFVLRREETLRSLLKWAHEQNYYLCNLFATDDRLLVDRTFKLYYLLSSRAEDEIVILEYFVPDPERGIYASVTDIFPNAVPLEREIHDMFGLVAIQPDHSHSRPGFLLHPGAYPAEFYPLRRNRTLSALREKRLTPFSLYDSQAAYTADHLPDGMLVVPVGPIHAGIIEAGHFPFHVAGEVVESLPIRLGYKHRGVEKLFETHYTLQDGWKLAERVSGDSAVAHSVAYCQAVEDLAQIDIPAVIYQWRALFLELERLYNHISDMGLLATGMAYEQAASSLATLRELFVHFVNQRLSGNRFLRGLCFPGGVRSPERGILGELYPHMAIVVEEALRWGQAMMEMPECRERMLTTGILTRDEARYATGIIARASGWTTHDFRLQHPSPAYATSEVKKLLLETITQEDKTSPRLVPVYAHDLAGDVFARLAIRVAETETSLYLVRELIKALEDQAHDPSPAISLDKSLTRMPEMTMGIGYAEGWRGDVMYVVFNGPGNTIARCKVRDPSTFNWHVFPEAVMRKKADRNNGKFLENILADFPLINKSFNLSYAGNDL